MLETWVISPDAPDYEVSNFGAVRRRVSGRTNAKAGHVMKSFPDSRGYVGIPLRVDGKRMNFWVHRLVCRAFHGDPPSPAHQAAHNDGNRAHNNALNIRWATIEENKADQLRHGTRLMGESHPNTKLTPNKVVAIRKDTRPQPQIAADYGITQQTVSRLKSGASWKNLKDGL